MFQFDVIWLFSFFITPFTRQFYRPTPKRKDGTSAVFPHSKSSQKPDKGKKKMQSPSTWLPHLSVRYQSWHWRSWAANLQRNAMLHGDTSDRDTHCLGVVVTCADSGGRKGSKSGVRGKAMSGKLLEGDTSFKRGCNNNNPWEEPLGNASFKGKNHRILNS